MYQLDLNLILIRFYISYNSCSASNVHGLKVSDRYRRERFRNFSRFIVGRLPKQ